MWWARLVRIKCQVAEDVVVGPVPRQDIDFDVPLDQGREEGTKHLHAFAALEVEFGQCHDKFFFCWWVDRLGCASPAADRPTIKIIHGRTSSIDSFELAQSALERGQGSSTAGWMRVEQRSIHGLS